MEKRTERRKHFLHTNVAGFMYWDGCEAFSRLEIGTKLALDAYCDTKKEDVCFTRSIVCGELLLWMVEVIDCVPKEQLENLVNKIVSCRIPAPSGRYIYDRKRWNKEIQKLCFDSIASVINQIQ